MPKKQPKDDWQTPLMILDAVDKFWPEGWFDPCPPNPTFDGLGVKWPEKCFINPPFSQYLRWAKHGRLQPREQIWICHHDSSTRRVQELLPGATLCLLYDRVSFIDPVTGLPKGTDPAKSQTLIYRGNYVKDFARIFQPLGFVCEQVNVTPYKLVGHKMYTGGG